jgi:hypothetical protein
MRFVLENAIVMAGGRMFANEMWRAVGSGRRNEKRDGAC